MNKNILNKGLVIGIIFLFICIVLTPCMVGKKILRVSTINYGIFISETNPNSGSLLGYVNDTSGNPIEGALVKVFFHGTFRKDFSDEDGYYHVTNIPICWCMKDAVCSKRGYKSERVSLGIVENTVHDFVLTPREETIGFITFEAWALDYTSIYSKTLNNPFLEQFPILLLLL